MHDAYINGRSENNIKCVVHVDLWWKNRTTRYILPRHWFYEWFSQFRRCGTYSVLSRIPSIVKIFPKILDNSDRQSNWLLPLPVPDLDLIRRSIWVDQLPITEFCLCWSVTGLHLCRPITGLHLCRAIAGLHLCRPIMGLHLCRPVTGLYLCQPIPGSVYANQSQV